MSFTPMIHHVAWFNEAPVAPCPEGGLTSADNNVCRRCLQPARELEKLGTECSVFGNLQGADTNEVCQRLETLDIDIVIIGRMSDPSLLRLARAAKHHGCYIIADLDDASHLSPDTIELADLADQVVAATETAADIILQRTGLHPLIIPDCTEDISPEAIALLWHDGLKHLKLKPPVCANTNLPQ